MTLDEIIDNLETQLNRVVNEAPVKRTMFGDLDYARFETPSVLFILTDASQNDLQVLRPNQIGWNISYDVLVMHSGADGEQTTKDARKLVNKIYQRLQYQRQAGKLLNGNAFDLACVRIEYGSVNLNIGEDVFMYGGLIKLIIQVIETGVID